MPAKARRQRDLNNTQTTKIIKMHIAQPITILNVKCSSTLYSKALWTQPLLALKPNQTFLFIEGSTKLCLGVTQPPSSHTTWFKMTGRVPQWIFGEKNGLPRANGPYLETKGDIAMGQTGNMVVTHIRQQTFTKNWLPKQKNRFFGWLGPIWGRHTILHLPCSRHRRAK